MSRVYVETPLFDRVVEGLSGALSTLTVGPGLDTGAQVNPLVSVTHQRKVLGFLEEAQAVGAELVQGKSGADSRGYYVRPTLVVNPAPALRLTREEVFGPVLAITRVADAAEAIVKANDTDYGPRREPVDARPAGDAQPDPADPGRHGVGQQSRAHRSEPPVRRLQAIGHRAGLRSAMARGLYRRESGVHRALNVGMPELSGRVYGALLNHRSAIDALGATVLDAPYKGAPRAPVLFIKPRNTLAGDGTRLPFRRMRPSWKWPEGWA